jgi:rhamnosyltransferase
MVARLIAAHQQASADHPGKVVAAVGPRIIDPRDAYEYPFIRLGWLRNAHLRHRQGGAKTIACDFLISSGSLFAISAVDTIGRFEDALFIDNVDFEWCCRARAADFLLFGVCDATLDHRLGDERRLILNRFSLVVHSPSRVYYQTRNRLLLYRRGYVPLKWKLKDMLRMTARFVAIMLFVAPRMEYLRMTLLATLDGIANRGGRLDESG